MHFSLRARLSLIAAAVVSIALAIGGYAWIEIVEFRMLGELRLHARSLAAREVVLRSSHEPDWRDHGGPPHDRPPPPERGDEGHRVVMHPPAGETLADDFAIAPDQARLEAWLEATSRDPKYRAAVNSVATLISEFVTARSGCGPGPPVRHDDPGPDGPPGRPGFGHEPFIGSQPERPAACRRAVDAVRDRALRAADQLQWPSAVVELGDRGRFLWTAAWVDRTDQSRASAVAVETSLASIDATAAVLWRSLQFGGSLLVVFVGVVTWFSVGRSFREVEQIQTEAASIAFGDLTRRIRSSESQDEISSLVETLNGMLDRIATGAERQRAFIGDASHELRTPIAVLRTRLEVALAHPTAVDWPKVATDAIEETRRLQRLVEDLLRIARLDDSPHDGSSASDTIDLDDLVRLEAAVVRGTTQIDLSEIVPIRIIGHEGDLRRVVANLLENARRYGGGRIAIGLAQVGDRARLEIHDDGPGISPADRERVFERFTRLDESRSRASGGAGLGLALSRGLVESHGGSLVIETSRLGGACFVVNLPIGPAPR